MQPGFVKLVFARDSPSVDVKDVAANRIKRREEVVRRLDDQYLLR